MMKVFLLIPVIMFFCLQGMSEKLSVNCDSPWFFIGIVEDLRSHGYRIPERLDEIEKEVCLKLNFESFTSSGNMQVRIKEGIRIIEGLTPLPMTQLLYAPGNDLKSFRTCKNELPVYATDFFFKNRLVTVGLKSYPYLIDFNHDGRTDLLVGDHDGFIYIYYNRGTSQNPCYGTPVRLKSSSTGKDIAVKFNPKMCFADMDGDGKKDIILGAYDGKPYMIHNDAQDAGFVFDDHKFAEFKLQSRILYVGNYAYPLAVDWNVDGEMDLLTGEIGGNVMICKNIGSPEKPVFVPPQKVVSISPDMYPDPAFADLDGDGLKDLILGSRSGNIYFFHNNGTESEPSFSSFSFLTYGDKRINPGSLAHIHVADWNSDGIPDLLCGNDDGEVRVYIGEKHDGGKIKFIREILLSTVEDTELIAKTHPVISLGDMNGDGKPDIVSGGEGGEIRFYPNTGSAKMAEFTNYTVIPGINMTADAFAGASLDEQVYWTNKGLSFVSEYLGNVSPEIVDWNNDGLLDLLVGSYTGLVYFYRNTGDIHSPVFAPPVPLKTGNQLLRVAAFSTPRAVDWNDDGLNDIICGDLYGHVYVYMNTGTAASPVLAQGKKVSINGKDFSVGPRAIPEFADINNDGLKDLLIGNRFGKVYVLLNRGKKGCPEFKDFEVMMDGSGKMWATLYGGGWAGPLSAKFPLKWKENKKISELCVEATSCPRIFDLNKDGEPELYISHRFGRIFLFQPIPQI